MLNANAKRSSSARPTGWKALLPPYSILGFALALVTIAVIALFQMRADESRARAANGVSQALDAIQQTLLVESSLKDAETGQRGFLLSGAEPYLEPYEAARAALPSQIRALRQLQGDNPRQRGNVDALETLAQQKLDELAETIALRRAGNAEAALALLRTDRGKQYMDRIRVVAGEMRDDLRAAFKQQRDAWEEAVAASQLINAGGALVLLGLIAASVVVTSRDYRTRETEAWLRAGVAGVGMKLQGNPRLDQIGEQVSAFLAERMDAQVGAFHVSQPDSGLRRSGGYALTAADRDATATGLVAQAARENRALHVRAAPAGYLRVASATGEAPAAELLIEPAAVDGVVQAIVELGFFRRVGAPERELLARIAEPLALAVRAARDRLRMEELLAETQRQGEELQAQQEELRVSNEELEEQSRALRESQARLENQQSELEQTNTQLEEQASMLEAQRDELARAQGALTERADELERANQYKSEFLANMSHELRTPLNSTLILAKLLADNKPGNLSDEQVKYAQTIASAGNDLLTLINDILDLSKIEAGKVDVQIEPVPLRRLVESLQATFEPMARQRGIGFAVTVAPGVPDAVTTDEGRAGQILKNLLSNALKFTESGAVTLGVEVRDGMAAFAVRDTGIGIAEQQREIIFEAFRQADGSTHRKYGGTGLGLSIARDLARLLGGDITVQSAPGHGSIFTLTLPLAGPPAAAAADAGSARPQAPPPRPPLRAPAFAAPAEPPPPAAQPVPDDRDALAAGARLILVVEDDVRFAEILRDLIRECGFQCVLTHTAGDGLDAAQRYLPSAVLLDMNLPDHSGLGVLDQLKRNPQTRHIPVHVISVADYSHEALEMGAVGYAFKPVKRDELISALKKLEARFMPGTRRVLVVEDDARQLESIGALLAAEDVQIVGAATAAAALQQLRTTTFDCMVLDLNLPDLSGHELLQQMAAADGDVSFPPVIVYTGRSLSAEQEQQLQRFSRAIIVKDARSPERLLDQVTLFLHQVESKLPAERQRMLQRARDRETALDGRRVLVVEDDVRNIFALSAVLEPKGIKVEIARNGREALTALERAGPGAASGPAAIDLVLMDIMMPEMDGLTAMREIRKRPDWGKLPIIALTAKAMKDDQEKCLAAGANDYIAKPLDVEKLLSLIRVWMPK